MPTPSVQVTPTREPSTAVWNSPWVTSSCVSVVPQVVPRSVETRVLRARLPSAIQVTATVEPLTAIDGRPARPDVVLNVVVPTVRFTQVTPRSFDVATMTSPLFELVNAMWTSVPDAATVGKSTRPVVPVSRTELFQ